MTALLRPLLSGVFTALTLAASAVQPELPDTFLIPERAVVATGSAEKGHTLVGVLYNPVNAHFSDPNAPRFLFLDREGKVAFGIGGYVKGTLSYDFCGAIDQGSDFITYDIPVPVNPAMRNRFYANANQTTLFMQLVGSTEHFGNYQIYVRSNFSGNGASGYGFKLKQAYMTLGYVTAGLTRSTFVDGSAGTPTIDDQGPAGEMSATNILLQYRPNFTSHWSGAISIEMPQATYTLTPETEKINQRVPDIPAYLQYAWKGGQSHVRLSGLLRNLSYRDLADGRNRFVTGWAVQLSGMVAFSKSFTLFYQGAYGKGYGRYVNDFEDNGLDLIPDAVTGRLKAPKSMNFEAGMRYNISPSAFLAASYSQARLYGQETLGSDAYRYGQYVSFSGFYDIVSDLRIGLEYLYGNRADINRVHNHANRINAMIQYSF
ncbi:MAG: hypothetical protein HDS02_05570 [Bacteroides sp.]|nr:hypothetical protein [Bacteroides sp.]